MSSEYPDVLGDLVEARQRFEVNGVHYMMALEPAAMAPGEAAALRVWLQNCWDVPVKMTVTLHLPATPSPSLWAIQERTEVPLEAAEVGELTIPIATAAGAEPRAYPLSVAIGARYETRGQYIRSQKMGGEFADPLLSFTTGMALAATMGLGFVARTRTEQKFSLTLTGSPQPGPEPDLTPTFLSHWTVDQLTIQGKARQLVNDRRLFLLPQITHEALFKAFLDESEVRLADASLALHVGEAIFLAKILTHTVEYFLQSAERQNVILIPSYVLAYRYNLPTGDPVFLIVRADYARIARLAISLSFGLLRQQLKREVWTVEEHRAVADLVADRVERGGTLPAEFLYLPLLLGGLAVARQVTMPGEDVDQSLALLAQARYKRAAELAENTELVALLEQLLKMA
jgi:hypothetical protein